MANKMAKPNKELKAIYCSTQENKDKLLTEFLPSLDDEFKNVLQGYLIEAQSLFTKKPKTTDTEVKAKSNKLDEEGGDGSTSNSRASVASSVGGADDSFPVLLPQTPKLRKATRSRTAAKAAVLSGTSGTSVDETTSSVDETLTATGRPRRGAARVAQANVTKTLHEKMNSKKRRPTDMSASNSDTSLATSSTGSLTKKMQTVKIDSKVQFEEPDPDEVEMDAEDQEVEEGPKDKKLRLSVSTESLQQSVADEEEEETTVVQEETPLPPPLAEPEKPKAPPARKTRSVQKSSGTDEAPLQPQTSVEEKPSKAVRKTRSVRTSAPKPEVCQQETTEPAPQTDSTSTKGEDDEDGDQTSSLDEETCVETTVKEDATVKPFETSATGDETTISSGDKEEEVATEETTGMEVDEVEKPNRSFTSSNQKLDSTVVIESKKESPAMKSSANMDATYVKEDSPVSNENRSSEASMDKTTEPIEETTGTGQVPDEDQSDDTDEKDAQMDIDQPVEDTNEKTEDDAQMEHDVGNNETYVKESQTTEPEQEEARPKRLTRSVSTQKLEEAVTGQPPDVTSPVPSTSAASQATKTGPRRMTRSISAQRLVVEQPKGEKHLAPNANAKPAVQHQGGSPKIRLTHPSESDDLDSTMTADEAIASTVNKKFATLPRQPANKTGMKKAISTAAIPTPSTAGARTLSGMKAPSTSNLITAAKLSANKLGGATRKFTPHSPAKGTQPTSPKPNSSALFNRLRSKVPSNVVTSMMSPMRKPSSAVKATPISGVGAGASSNIVTTSFLPANNPLTGRPQRKAKPTAAEEAAKKEDELRKKKEKEEEVMRRKEEMAEAKREAKRKENEARQKRVLEARQKQEASKEKSRLQQEKEQKEKMESLKQAQILAEERRRKEQLAREEEEKRRKAEAEAEAERKRKAAEEKQRQQQEQEQRRKAAAEADAKAKKAKQEAEAKAAAKAKAAEAEARAKAKADADAKLKEEIRQQKLKLAQLQAKASQDHVDLNSTYSKEGGGGGGGGGGGNPLNTTYNAAANNYEITPARHELPQEVLNDPDNYDIANLRSDEDTDDEDNPRKKPAAWTQGSKFRQAIFHQAYYRDKDPDYVFAVQDATVELKDIFSEIKRRFNNRTSSAVWDVAPRSHKYDRP